MVPAKPSVNRHNRNQGFRVSLQWLSFGTKVRCVRSSNKVLEKVSGNRYFSNGMDATATELVQSNLPYPGSVNSITRKCPQLGNTVHCTMPMGV